MDFIEIFNTASKLAVPTHKQENNASSLDQELKSLGLDSLDIVLTFSYIADAYDLDEALTRKIPVTTIGDIKTFCEENGEFQFKSVAEMVEALQ